jgi:hypothetical protein
MEFSELNVEYGYCYESAAVVPDGSGAPAPADDIRVYEPSTARVLAAARVADDEDGRRRTVKDVVAPGRFLLIAGNGAIVVRPDRFIAWQSPAAASDPRAVHPTWAHIRFVSKASRQARRHAS